MKRLAIVISGTLAFSLAATATDYGQVDTFLGYTFTRFNSSSTLSTLPSHNANGGSTQWAYNFNNWFSGVIDTRAVTASGIGGARTFSQVDVNRTVVNILGGPRASLRSGRWRPYVQALFGGAYANSSALAVGVLPLPNKRSSRHHQLLGLCNASRRRPGYQSLQPRLLQTNPGGIFLERLQSFQGFGKEAWNNFRYSVAINFTYGRPQ